MQYKPTIINSGNASDIRTSLRFCEDKVSIANLQQEVIAEEAKGANCRSTIAQMLNAAIKRKRLAESRPMRVIDEMDLSEG